MPNKLTDVTDNKVGKITDNEIVKALEYCLKDGYDKCEKCQYYGTVMCTTELLSNALDLINRLQAKVEYYKQSRNKNQDDVMYLSKQLDNLQAEKEDIKFLAEAYKECIEKVKCEIASMLKELFAQRNEQINENENDFTSLTDLKVQIPNAKINILETFERNLDNLLKELVGDK